MRYLLWHLEVMFVLWNTYKENYLRRKNFDIWHYPDKVNATSANSLEPAGASVFADATLNWITPQHAGLALQALIDYKELIDFIPRIRVWGDFSGSKSNNWFTTCVKDRVSFKVWTPLTIKRAEPTQNATILISLLTFSHRVLVTPFMRQ